MKNKVENAQNFAKGLYELIKKHYPKLVDRGELFDEAGDVLPAEPTFKDISSITLEYCKANNFLSVDVQHNFGKQLIHNEIIIQDK